MQDDPKDILTQYVHFANEETETGQGKLDSCSPSPNTCVGCVRISVHSQGVDSRLHTELMGRQVGWKVVSNWTLLIPRLYASHRPSPTCLG